MVAQAQGTPGPLLVTGAANRLVLRFDATAGPLIAPVTVPYMGTLFIVFGGSSGAQASGRPMGWGDNVWGRYGVDILALPTGVWAIARNISERGDQFLDGAVPGPEVEAVSWGWDGVTFERRFADGSVSSCASSYCGGAPDGSDPACLSSGAMWGGVADGKYYLHIGSSGDGSQEFSGDLAELIVVPTHLKQDARLSKMDELYWDWLVPGP